MPDIIDKANRLENALFYFQQGKMSYSDALCEMLTVVNEYEKEIFDLKRRILGLETTVRNCKEKEEKRYRDMSWRGD